MDSTRLVTLGDVAELSGGFAFKSEQYVDFGRFVLRTVNIRDDASITRDGAVFISEDDARNFGRFALQEHDTLFVMVAATLGKIGYVRKGDLPALLNQNMWVIRAKPGRVDPVYLHYQFRELSKIPLAWVGGSARSFLRRDDVRTLKFILPDQRTQGLIGELLKALDDKIELNRRMNETLEAMARAIFKDWFVDFGPTRAKMEGRASYLAPDIWSLFPDRLDDDGKPERWRTGKLGDVAKQVGQTVSPETLDPETPYIGLEHMPRRSIALSEWEGAGKVTSGKLAFQRGDFLFGKLRPYFHKVGIAPLDGICSTDIVVLNARERSAAAFVLACISQDEFVAFTDRTSDGTKMPRTSWSRMERYGLCLPDGAALEAFNAFANPMLGRIVANIHESRTLAATRDLLLPKLMSGEVRVKDAEKLVGEAT
ncbi:restriction endonuclease subunit S [Acidocella aminolytica]|uniref:Type I restriction-modification methylase S subunit n=1 Tax=Acidocella aminolytica 101 = DSM 11237 TaxID=1120923 RepID=A0A0D6PC49_9PROT|nr:restriction endonuclease subunit S [Acidocella aminolytica]GAN78778.1 type I restriction-modification methylase S subunit [Acidocella aminolytica 101 = DSM 11237]GBQ36209.1 restriction endonuclease S subunit [Acidocella aminolytica 101 = DSM 11237]SHE79832.1 type I restriction enzyme, S subunit [Acidocella aminolytica 101 = DSM 11237]